MELKITFKNLKSMMNTQPLIKKWLTKFKSYLSSFDVIDWHNLLGLQTFILVNKKTNIKF